MNARVKELMEERAIHELESAKKMIDGSEGTTVATENATKIYKALADEEAQKEKAKNDRRSLGVSAACTAAGGALYWAMHKADVKFEMTNTFIHPSTRDLAQQARRFFSNLMNKR